MKNKEVFAVMGLTGQVGGATARALLQAGHTVRGVVRDPARAADWAAQGVELVTADAEDSPALAKAFRGADGVFIMVPPYFAPAPGFPETRAIVAALRRALEEAQPARLAALSSVGAQHEQGLGLITQSHLLEQELGTLALPTAFVRAAWFLENSLWDAASARERGEIAAFLTPLDRPFPMVSAEDIGALAAATLQQSWTGRRVLELEGPARYSQLDAAAAFARLLGHPVAARPVERDQWAALFEQQGTPADRTAPRIEMLDGFNSGWIDFEQNGTEHFRGIRTQEEVFRNLLKRQP